MTDASPPNAADDRATDASTAAGADGETGVGDRSDRPDRPPSARLVDALGVVDHAKRGLAVGLALAAAVFGFFVGLPLVDPSTPARPESPLLYLALAFVAATAATLLVASALAVRAVAGRVMDYAKWTCRGALVGALGGAWWTATGALALASTAGVAPESIRALVTATLPLPVLVLAVGAWSALARTAGDGPDTSATTTEGTSADAEGFDHVLARPRTATAGAVLVLVGAGVLHVATFLETDAVLGASAPAPASLLVLGTLALAAGTAALADALARHSDLGSLAAASGALAGVAAGLTLAAAITGPPALAPLGALVLPGIAWLALGTAIARTPGTYPDRPV
ncbi:hypothetical protein [Halorubellus sp. JP-L1]|uniref:DUF7536 family protein n=1 Tax=Halorubellus sp. JP-L1 TaxID=2715753 RepID=UPI0019634ED2|nr:hypothetical protein [Halorubellus sp. JP-L1]